MRIYLDQIGCRLNYSEMDTLARQLRVAGHQVVADVEQAQVVVFNSCAVTSMASRKSRQRIRQIHRANPSARIAATGCWSSLEADKAEALAGVSMVVENSDKELLASLLEPWSSELDSLDELARMQPDGHPLDGVMANRSLDTRQGRTRAFIKVQDGCNNRCTFCIVTLARGDSRSRSVVDVAEEVQFLVQEGISEAVLTGVHLGSYGRDISGDSETDLNQLVETILSETSIQRLRLSSLEPWELCDGFFELWQRWPNRLCPHLHLPLQAGTDKQLRAMARRCTVDSFRELVETARAAIPDLVLTTDIIVGFPGESDADFEQTLEYVEEMRFAHAHIFPYSPRPGTAAARFASMVPNLVKKKRSRRMHEVVSRTGAKERHRFLGTSRPILWEGSGEELEDSNRLLWTGLTDNYLRVSAEAPAGVDLGNTITHTHLAELHGETFFGTVQEDELQQAQAEIA